MSTTSNPYRGFRYPAEIINQAVWLYHCFSLSLREVELILAARASRSAMRPSASAASASGGPTQTASSGGGCNPVINGTLMVCHEHISEGGDVELYKR